MSKGSSASSSTSSPVYRIGDLVWCQEAKNPKLWWPAMVTYDPHAGVFFRTTKCLQYHVQYFGISAIRGWVSFKSCVPLNTGKEKTFVRKGLSNKLKSEYEVAMQEVAEATKLDYKQRKLKFIFSFRPSNKKHAKQKVQVKLEPEVEGGSGGSLPAEGKKKAETAPKKRGGSDPQSKSSCSKMEVDSGAEGNLKTPTSSGKIKATLKSKGGGVLSPPPVTKKKKPSQAPAPTVATPTNGHSNEDNPPSHLHSEHSSEVSVNKRRSRSDSYPLDCERCLEYLTSCEGIELKCTSKPEVFVDPGIETSAQPIRMYVQRQYEGSETLVPSKTSVPPNLNSKPFTKGMSTKNISTDVLPGSAKQPYPLTGRVKDLERGVKAGASGGRSGSSSPVLATFNSASNDGVSSESGYETAQSASRKKKKKLPSTSGSVSALGSSPLVEMTSAGEEPVTRKRKRGKSSSLSSLPAEVAGSSEDQTEEVFTLTKRTRRSSIKSFQPLTSQSTERSRRSSTTLKGPSCSVSALSANFASGSAHDSCSEVSTTSPAASVETPPSSISDELPSVDLEAKGSSATQEPKEKKAKLTLSVGDSNLGICSICDCEGSDLLCTGHCMSSFHMDCLGLMEKPSFDFACDECLISRGTCFVCGKAQGEVQRCNKPKCSKLYHPECIEGNKLFQHAYGKSSTFTCPLHACARCSSIGVSNIGHSNLLQCVKCPLALHKPDCLVAGCEVIDQSRMLCYQHLKISKSTKLYSHMNLNTCLECGAIGSLYCCDVCSAAYHLECLDQDARPASDTNHWKCPSCAVHDLPTYGSLVITKFGVWRWWPSEVVLPEDIPDNILSKKPGDCMFVVRFCGSRDFCWTYHGRVLPYTDEAELEGMSHKKPKASDNYKQACEEAKEIHSRRRKALEAKEAEAKEADKQNSKFYTKIKTNKYLVPRPHSEHESLDFLPCQCTVDSPCNEDSTCVNRAIHIECNPKNCPVKDLCQNQRMQKFQNAKTELVFTGDRGWGLKTTADLCAGDFVIEYVGEVLDEAMCQERLKKAHAQSNHNFYMLTLDAGLVIDAGRKSNYARFINHSCGPNCETQKWRVRGEPRIGIFARVNIPSGTELTFDYQLDSLGNEKKKCFCGSKNCSGFLGVRSLKMVSDESKLKSKKKKKPKQRLPVVKKEDTTEEEEDRHDDECFICKDGGELLLCDRKTCCRAYHLQCINRKVFPPKSQKWECPWHFCGKCQKFSVSFCSTCPVSFCSKHLKGNLSVLPHGENIMMCQSCLEHREEAVVKGEPSSVITGRNPESLEREEAKFSKVKSPKGKVKSPPGPSISPIVPSQEKETVQLSKNNEWANKKKSPPQGALSPLSESSKDKVPRPSPQLLGLLEKSPPPSRPLVISEVPPEAVGSSVPSSMSASPHLKYPLATEPSVGGGLVDPMPQGMVAANVVPSRVPEPHRSPQPSAFRAPSRATLFQPQSPTFGHNYSMPIPESHAAKLPEGYVDFGAHAAAAATFQQPQQQPVYNSFIPPMWFMPRNGFVNSLDPSGGGFSYPTYPSALINPNPLGFPYFSEPLSNFGMHHQQPMPSASVVPPASSSAASSPSFSTVLPPTHPQNGFLAWKYC